MKTLSAIEMKDLEKRQRRERRVLMRALAVKVVHSGWFDQIHEEGAVCAMRGGMHPRSWVYGKLIRMTTIAIGGSFSDLTYLYLGEDGYVYANAGGSQARRVTRLYTFSERLIDKANQNLQTLLRGGALDKEWNSTNSVFA